MTEPDSADKDALAEAIYLASDSYEDDGIEWANQFGSPRREAERQAEAVAAFLSARLTLRTGGRA